MARREPILGVWRRSPQWDPGAKTVVRGAGGEIPLKLMTFYRPI